MAKASYMQKGDVIDYTNAAETAVEYHDVLVIGSLVGIALEPITKGSTGPFPSRASSGFLRTLRHHRRHAGLLG